MGGRRHHRSGRLGGSGLAAPFRVAIDRYEERWGTELKVGTRAFVRGIAVVVTVCLIVGIAVTQATSATPTRNRGYWIAGAHAQVFAFGDAEIASPTDLRTIRAQIVDLAAHPMGRGYWLLGQDGAVYPYGEARDLGQGNVREQNAIAIAPTPSGNGYFIATELGEVRAFGDAVGRGSLASRDLVRKIVDMATTPSGAGYWLVDATGRVFAFGDASPYGSLPAGHEDVAGIAASPHGNGYWVATAGGDTFAFGTVPALAGAGAGKKVVDITPTSTGRGYWLVDRDGLVYPRGDAASYGQLAPRDLRSGQVTAIVATPFVDHPPVAVNDSATFDEDTSVDIDVLANDTDEDGDPLTATLLTTAAHGTVTQNVTGTFHYAPAANYNGTDGFTYTVSDGVGGTAIGTVTLTIRPVNDAPVATDDAFTIDEDTTLSNSLTANDTDVDGDVLTAHVVSGPAHGSVALGPSGAFTYTPAPNYNGDDVFIYRAFDGLLESANATVRIHINPVNDAPVSVADTASVNEDEVLTAPAPGVLANDSDVDGDPITALLVSRPTHGTLTLGADGSYVYRPAPNYNGTDSFVYRAFDGHLASDDATVTITVIPVNDPPVAVADTYDTNEDTALVVSAPGLLGNDTDVDGDTLSVEVIATTAHGTLTMQPDGSFRYDPAADFNGTDTFTYRAHDAVTTSDAVIVTIHIAPVNDAPRTSEDLYGVDEDDVLVVPAPGVLVNDIDVEGSPITATLVSGPSHGALTLGSDGSFQYTPAANFNGTDSFVYTASDGSLDSVPTTVTIIVGPVNDPPVGSPDAYTTDEDNALVVAAPGVLANDTDIDGDALTARLAASPQHGDVSLQPDGSFVYIPDPNFHGVDTFTYDVTDGAAVDFAITVSITVNSVPDPPAAADDSYTTTVGATLTVDAPGVLANDFSDTDTLTAVLVTGVAHGTLSLQADGSFTYTTSLATAGTDSFTYYVSDGALSSDPATVQIAVNASGGSGGGGSFGSFANPTLTVWDYDVLKIGAGTGTPRTKYGQVVKRADGTFYVPDRGVRGHDSFDYGGRHYEIDILSDIWGD